MLWFTDLTAPDPYYGLPIMCAGATAGMVRFGMNLDGGANPVASNPMQKKIMQ